MRWIYGKQWWWSSNGIASFVFIFLSLPPSLAFSRHKPGQSSRNGTRSPLPLRIYPPVKGGGLLTKTITQSESKAMSKASARPDLHIYRPISKYKVDISFPISRLSFALSFIRTRINASRIHTKIVKFSFRECGRKKRVFVGCMCACVCIYIYKIES